MTNKELVKVWLDELDKVKYELKLIQDSTTNAINHINQLKVGMVLSPLNDDENKWIDKEKRYDE